MTDVAPLWCSNSSPHEAHQTRNEFDGTNYCSGRPWGEQVDAPFPSEVQVLRTAIVTALEKLRWFPSNGVDKDLRSALLRADRAAVSDPQRRNGE